VNHEKASVHPLCKLLISKGSLRAKQKPNGTLSFSVIDNRKSIAREIDANLLLRAVKASSLKQADFGWDVEVVEKSSNDGSFLNLLYHSHSGMVLIRHRFTLGMLVRGCFVMSGSLKYVVTLTW